MEGYHMSKQLTSQRYIYKIHSARLRRAKWDLRLTIDQARENKELIALNDSQLLRFIDELNGDIRPGLRISNLKAQIRQLKAEENLSISRPRIKKLYAQLDEYLFQKDYICVVIDSVKDYRKMYKDGFRINDTVYRRLLGTTGGVKSNTIIFVNERLLPELNRRIDNGRNLSKAFTPAKLEAYRSLVCSSSTPVSMPQGIVVVHDCITHFKSDVIELDDSHGGQPRMKYIEDKDIELNDSDGYGLAMPELMERWGRDIGADYLLPGCVLRNAFCKGAIFPVDFRKFAREHQVSEVIDVWGNTHNIQNIELVLTESMLKLWDSYDSMEDYLENCRKNHYSFAITKASGEKLENLRTMNYQFLQSYHFTDDEIDELIQPTVDEINDILSEDYRKTILYTKGTGLNEKNVRHSDGSFATALMIEPEMINDSYVRDRLYRMIQKRIDQAKVGVLNVPANYSLISGDPYSLCQSMFRLEITGLLKAGQVYSRYWTEHGVDQIVSFRAPMTSHNNIRVLQVVHSEEMDEFYQYMTTPTIFNSWDTCADAMNGMDKDGDCVINSAFPLLIKEARPLPAVRCVQRKAPKCVPAEDDLMLSNINSFGNAVGEVTNRITAMFEVQARFPENSREYRILEYRIKCGQLYQQNSIDKTKGIEARPMPEAWYHPPRHMASAKDFQNLKLAADKKPYFMQYIYPAEKARLKAYIKKNEEKCIMRFRKNIDELMSQDERTEEEENFIRYFHDKMPMGTAPCTMNKICRKIESLFDDYQISKAPHFDYSILKSEAAYSTRLFQKIKKIYEQYQRETAGFMQYAKSERLKPEECRMQKYIFKENFKRQCLSECPNEDILCNIVLDLCYSKSRASKQFAWDICGDQFIRNLLKRSRYKISYPEADESGDILFNGERFKMKTITLDMNQERKEEHDTDIKRSEGSQKAS